jgi:uncharacterized protein with HEPN domain
VKRTIKHFLEDVIEYCDKAQNFVEGITFEEFCSDEKTFLAVTRVLEIIGEALKNIPEEVRSKYPEIPWREIIGFRNTVAHVYFGINTKIVWNSAKEDTKFLKPHIQKILDNLEE